jgi:hypothetical protein
MTIELPDEEIGGLQLTAEQARVELAIGLYAGREVSLGRAAKIASLSYTASCKKRQSAALALITLQRTRWSTFKQFAGDSGNDRRQLHLGQDDFAE